MAVTQKAVRVRTSDGWMDVALVGPKGADGAPGAPGAAGAAGVGVPTGGTTGQVLAKHSSVNYDTEWIAAPTGGGGGGSSTGALIYTQTIGDGSSKAFTVTHGLGTRNIVVSVYRTASPYDEIIAEIERTDFNTITVRTTTVPAVNEYTVIVTGPSGSTNAYTHTQSTPASTWSIPHNLNRRPSVTVVDTGDTVIIADVRYVDPNNVQVVFGSATSGKAYLN